MRSVGWLLDETMGRPGFPFLRPGFTFVCSGCFLVFINVTVVKHTFNVNRVTLWNRVSNVPV